MSLRTRLLIAFAAVVCVPMALLAFGFRQEMSGRLTREYEERLETVATVIEDDLRLESAAIGDRLASLAREVQDDNRFRAATVAGVETEQRYLRDYAGTAMRLTGLSMLQIQDDEGRILSSGHFRNEYGRIEAGLVSALAAAPSGVALVAARRPDREFLALARGETFGVVGGRTFTLVGGIIVDDAFLWRLARDATIAVSLQYPGGALSSDGVVGPDDAVSARTALDRATRDIPVPLIRSVAAAPVEVVEAHLLVMQPLTPLRTLLRSLDRWIVTAAAVTGITALLLAVWVSSRISRPIAALADKTAVLDLDRLDVEFDEGTDEVGRLSRVLGDLATRLRSSTARIREAERRATIGDLARQVNHDVKNGLIPLRNVMRHLIQVGQQEPGALPSVLAERRQTVESSLAYLETLATNYERLSTRPERRACDVNVLIADVVRGARGHDAAELRTDLAAALPLVMGDPVAIRRILDNLTANAIDSLDGRAGRITISTRAVRADGAPPVVKVTVADTGHGMTAEETSRIFADFYTTKKSGTGLGLSIVRRLVMDLHGRIHVESAPGAGTRMIVEMPAMAAGHREPHESAAIP